MAQKPDLSTSALTESLNAAFGDSEMPHSAATPVSQLPAQEQTQPAVAETKTTETKTVEPKQNEVTKPAEVKTLETPEEIKTPEIKTPSNLLDSLLTPESEKTKKLEKVDDVATLTDEEKLPGKATAQANSAFAAKARALKAAEQENLKLKAELEAARKAGSSEASSEIQSIKAELEENKKLLSEYENQLSMVRLESTREFKRNISEPLSKAEKSLADSLAGYEGINAKDVIRILDIDDPAKRKAEFKDLMAGVDPMDAWSVKTKLDEIEQIRSKKNDLLKEANATLEKMERDETAQEQEARLKFDKEADVAFESTWNKFEDSYPILKRGQSAEWDQTIKQLRDQAVYLDKQPLDHNQRATLTYQAVLFPLAVKVVQDLTEKSNAVIADLKSQLAKYQAATPGAGASENNTQTASIPSTAGFLDVLEKSLGR